MYGSSKGTMSQPKSSGKTVQLEEPVFKVADSDIPQDQEGNLGDNEDEPRSETASRRDWFKKPTPPQEPTDLVYHIGESNVIRKHGYGYLEEIVVRRADNALYRFKEGDFLRLRINDIEDMLLLVVQMQEACNRGYVVTSQ
ncbi:hypothetical protein Tco_1030990 [Tanacetum coccineum]|uniref:Uncharacterized protein n=1 Tax=Tanacetum coccineum TaxID=301880 RepID=A0ABQ5G9G3_9ASTR